MIPFLNQEPGNFILVFNVVDVFPPRKAFDTVPVNIAVKVNNTGNRISSDIVKEEINNRVIGAEVVEIRPGETRSLVFTWIPTETGAVDVCGQLNGSVKCGSVNVVPSSEFPGHQQCIVKTVVKGSEVLREVPVFGRTGCLEK